MAEDIQDTIRRRIEILLRRHQVPSLTVGLAQSGKPLYLESVGFADVPAGRPACPLTQYRLGSITKTFTAALVLGLAERGVLDLDEPVEAFFPGTSVGLPGTSVGLPATNVGRARLRQLLAHTGGVQREAPLPMWSTMQGPDRDGLLQSLARAESVGRPGSRWHYSNLGYAILGEIVRRVTGTPGEDLISAHFLTPLGLTSTTWQPEPERAVGYRLDPYQRGVVYREPEMDQGAIGIGGQLWSTAEDLLGWGHALLGGAPEVVPATVATAMHTPQVMVDQDNWNQGWGLGLILDRRGGRILSGHTGGMPGFMSALAMDRRRQFVAVAFANVTRGIRLPDLCAELIDDALERYPDGSGPVLGVPVQGLPAELIGVLGRWWSESEETIFSWQHGGLHARLTEAPQIAATQIQVTSSPVMESSATTFRREGPDRYRASSGRLCGESLRIKRDERGDVVELEWATYPYRRQPN